MTIGTDKRGTGHYGAIAWREQGRLGPRILAVATVALVPSAALAGPPPACSYTVTVIESPLMCGSTPESTGAKAITADGVVAGDRSCVSSNVKPFLWSTSGGYQALPGPPGSSNSPLAAMNRNLEIVGTGNFPEVRGYLRTADGQYVVLPTAPTGNWSEALGVSDSTVVLGMWANVISGPSPVPCRWDGGTLTDLSGLLGAPEGRAYEMNSRGQITGWTGTSPLNDARAFILDGDQATILPPIPDGFTSEGRAIDDRGNLAGLGRVNTGTLPAQAWRAMAYIDGIMVNLGTLPGQVNSIASDINHDQVVVGSTDTPTSRAFVWQDSVMRDLNDLIPSSALHVIKIAYAISDDGVIAARGTLGSPAGPVRGFILTPVYPSPADLNGDCHVVDGQDLALLLGQWGSVKRGVDGPSADLNQDGVVNGIDLAILLGEWG